MMKNITIPCVDTSQISDGYHTFGELYGHRNLLFISLCFALNHKVDVFKAKDPNIGGWFVLYLMLPKGQVSYHIEMEFWYLVSAIEEIEYGSVYDGHDSSNVWQRLLEFIISGL